MTDSKNKESKSKKGSNLLKILGIFLWIFFLIFWISSIIYNKKIKENSTFSVSYSLNEKITDQDKVVLHLNQKYIKKIMINDEVINFDKKQNKIDYTFPLELGENHILITGKNKFHKEYSIKEITRLSSNDYQAHLKKLEEERIAERERQKREYTGIWSILNFVDSFGDKTENTYITTKEALRGTFSNTATKDSSLHVELIINDENKIAFQLYEYASNNPVKSSSSTWYTMDVKDKDGITYNFGYMTNNSDRIFINKLLDSNLGAIDLHNILLKGGEIKFVITENKYPSEYKFTISNADGYDNIFRKFQEGK